MSTPTFDLNHDGTVTIDDLYAWALAPVDLNGDGIANERDQHELEQAIRFGEAAGMGIHR